MSTQQADILTSELEYYRRLLTPVIQQICTAFLRTIGSTAEISVEWDTINLQDETEQALARLHTAQAMQIEQKKSAGLVVSCEFPHATPADCASHYYNRNDYKVLAPQMAYNNLEVMFGGGTDFVTDDMKKHFQNTGTTYIQNDKNAVLNFTGNRIWGLF